MKKYKSLDYAWRPYQVMLITLSKILEQSSALPVNDLGLNPALFQKCWLTIGRCHTTCLSEENPSLRIGLEIDSDFLDF